MARTAIVDFYAGGGTDHRGRTLAQLQMQTMRELEEVHDYIQWLFPLAQPSSASAEAPILTREDIATFRESPDLQRRLIQSLRTMLRFYGIALVGTCETPAVALAPDFAARRPMWRGSRNHNLKRMSRILGSLTLLGRRTQALALLACLEEVIAQEPDDAATTTLGFWRAAVADVATDCL